MRKRILLVLILVMLGLAICLSACVKDKSRTQFVYDDKDLFDETQEETINRACQDATKQYGVTFLVATCDRQNDLATMWGKDLMAREGLDDDDDYVLIILNAVDYQYDYHFDIYTYGRADTRLSYEEVEDALYSNYGDLILTSQSAGATTGLVGMIPMLGRAYDFLPLWLNIVLGILIGLAVGGVVIGMIGRSYSAKRKNVIYPLDKYCQMHLTGSEDSFLRSTTTVTVIDNGGHSGGMGGGAGSGGGGGGGHRGGR